MMSSPLPDDTILARWLGGTLSESEERSLRERPDFPDYERIARVAGEWQPPPYDARTELARLKKRRTVPVRRTLRPLLAVAATLALLLIAWSVWPRPGKALHAGVAETTLATLSDGSVVRLNAASEFTFREHDRRLGVLEGEAWFEVKQAEEPFVVETTAGSVTVLGTSFNVYSREGSLRVSCVTGKVAVRPTDRSGEALLTPGQTASLRPGEVLVTGPTDEAEALDWLEGVSAFTARPLREVIRELERQFGLEFSLPDELDRDQKITTAFPNDDPAAALDLVFGALPAIRFSRSGDTVTVTVP